MSNEAVVIVRNILFAEALAACLEKPGSLQCRVFPYADILLPRKFHETDTSQAVILLELNGDSRDNARVLRRVRNRWPNSRSIIISETADDDEIAEFFDQGAWGIFPPSEGVESLKKAIRTVGDGEIWACRRNSSHIIRHLRKSRRKSSKKGTPQISGRERQVLALVAGGLKNRHIADKLCISEQTVKVHLNNIYKKIGAKDRLQAALFAIDKGMTPGKVPLNE